MDYNFYEIDFFAKVNLKEIEKLLVTLQRNDSKKLAIAQKELEQKNTINFNNNFFAFIVNGNKNCVCGKKLAEIFLQEDVCWTDLEIKEQQQQYFYFEIWPEIKEVCFACFVQIEQKRRFKLTETLKPNSLVIVDSFQNKRIIKEQKAMFCSRKLCLSQQELNFLNKETQSSNWQEQIEMINQEYLNNSRVDFLKKFF